MTMAAATEHYSVMLDEAIEGLAIKADGTYIDATYGRGGHSQAILSALGAQGRLLAFDRDLEAVADAKKKMSEEPRFEMIHSEFGNMDKAIRHHGLFGKVDGILCDLGVSSPQLDNAERGFSFRFDGALDMRMDQSQGQSAAAWLQVAEEREIEKVLRDYGEERYARRIASKIVTQRQSAPIATTAELRELIIQASPRREHHKDPATRCFQALRIQVNDELGELKKLLDQALSILAPAGRLIIISFHSLEDRIVKRFMRKHSQTINNVPSEIPLLAKNSMTALKRVGKALKASEKELAENPRSRSAIMRIAEKCPC